MSDGIEPARQVVREIRRRHDAAAHAVNVKVHISDTRCCELFEALDGAGLALLDCAEVLAAIVDQGFIDGAGNVESYAESALRQLGTSLELKDASTWMPIETAPRDGTDVLVFDGGVCMAAFRPLLGWSTSPYGEEPIDPTHWLPLPEPPEGEVGE